MTAREFIHMLHGMLAHDPKTLNVKQTEAIKKHLASVHLDEPAAPVAHPDKLHNS